MHNASPLTIYQYCTPFAKGEEPRIPALILKCGESPHSKFAGLNDDQGQISEITRTNDAIDCH